jgi:hypothetical protein
MQPFQLPEPTVKQYLNFFSAVMMPKPEALSVLKEHIAVNL